MAEETKLGRLHEFKHSGLKHNNCWPCFVYHFLIHNMLQYMFLSFDNSSLFSDFYDKLGFTNKKYFGLSPHRGIFVDKCKLYIIILSFPDSMTFTRVKEALWVFSRVFNFHHSFPPSIKSCFSNAEYFNTQWTVVYKFMFIYT